MTSLKNIYRERVGVSYRDNLTDLYNHGVFSLFVDEEIRRATRYGRTFSLALVSVDHFRSYNRRQGRISGDLALKSIARKLLDETRNSDIVSRLMADVFGILFPETESQHAITALERMRTSIRDNFQNQLTLSAGLIGWNPQIKKESHCIELARQAMSLAKQKGRDTIVHCGEEESAEPSEGCGRILIVDDDIINAQAIEAMLRPHYSGIVKAKNGQEALFVLDKEEFDIVLLDVMMPGMDGFEVCRRIRTNPKTVLLPIILITALDDKKSKVKGFQSGANDFITKPIDMQEMIARTGSLIRLWRATNKLTGIESVLFSMARSIEAKDPYTRGHSERVANIAVSIGKRLALNNRDLEALKYGGYLHDVGKIGTPVNVLHKPAKLNESEWEIIQKHPVDGYYIALPLYRELGKALEVIRYHHERMDGSGYPEGLTGEEIPFLARILAVADTFDAMTTDRPYRPRIETPKAVEIIKKEAEQGKLDPQVVGIYTEMISASGMNAFIEIFDDREDEDKTEMHAPKHRQKSKGQFMAPPAFLNRSMTAGSE